MCTIYCVLFFVFKQKTAYEMRISDWSSDVCSSDLLVARGNATPAGDGEGLAAIALERIAFGRSDLQDVSVVLGDDGVHAAIRTGTLDAEPFLSGDAGEAEAAAEAPSRSFTPLSVLAPNLRVLYFAGDRRLEQVNLELRRGRLGWETIRVSGSIPEQYWSPRPVPAPDAAPDAASAPDSGPNTEPNTEPDATAGPPPDAAPPPAPAAELTRRYLQFSFAPDAAGGGQHLLAQSDDLGALLRENGRAHV